MLCTACGAKIKEGQGFCTNCGVFLAVPPENPQEIIRTAPPAKKKSLSPSVTGAIVIGVTMVVGYLWRVAIPYLLTFRDKAKLEETMADMNTISIALENYISDYGRTPVQNGSFEGNSQFRQALSPLYAKVLPFKDQWGHYFLVYCGQACNGQYGISGARDIDYLIVSLGKDGIKENWEYTPYTFYLPLLKTGSPRHFDQDLIWYSGRWIHGPQ